jgi:hypothetical protein
MSGRIDKMPLNKLLEIVRDDLASTEKARDMAVKEILRRENAFRKIVEGALTAVEGDERLGYPTATVFENAPLALAQCGLENQRRALKYVLKALDAMEGEV